MTLSHPDSHRMVQVAPGHAALVLDSPHSGTHYPDDFRPACAMQALRVAEDTHVESLWGFAPALGVTLVQALFPRSYIDVNRSLEDVDESLLDAPWPGPVAAGGQARLGKARLGKGLVWRMLDDGTPIYDRRLPVTELRSRIDRCWRPYHRALDEAVNAAVARHGHAIHLNCHSMPAVAQAFSTDHPGLVHADFVLGDRDGTSAAPQLTAWIGRFLSSRGYSVSANHPYKGVEIVRRQGRPAERRHSIQVEINKRLYMDEVSLQVTDGFEPLQQTLDALTRALLSLDLDRLLAAADGQAPSGGTE